MCAKKGSNEKTTRSEKQVHVLQLKPDSITATKKSVKQQAKSSKKAVMPKLEKKNPPTVVVVANPDGHKSIEEAVAEGLILDPAPFKIEGNLDARPPKHPKFGDELQRIIENPHSSSSETSVSSCSDECNERKRKRAKTSKFRNPRGASSLFLCRPLALCAPKNQLKCSSSVFWRLFCSSSTSVSPPQMHNV
ncbi:hypothetical protein L3Y34_002070 [Caenorhabditis briggsae]|uniref:Uncharacterized protein n=1 Tax=Caenorhabditis briggsae TaxID=6238 RepID=A0AAE9DDW5_CAEBR|nr:hypothetical protein L3Y34_002070 [Caenorhabditis briggsae]